MGIISAGVAKQYLQINHSAEDDVIEIMIASAQEFVEKFTGVYLHDGNGQVVELLDGGAKQLWPTKLPIQAVTKIEDTDYDDEEEDEWKATEIRILKATDGEKWGEGNQRYRVTYTAGYGPDNVPAGIKQIMLDLVYRSHSSRGGKSHQSQAGFGYDWQDLMDSDVIKRLRRYRYKGSIG